MAEFTTANGYSVSTSWEGNICYALIQPPDAEEAKRFKFDAEPDGILCEKTYDGWAIDEEIRIANEKKTAWEASINQIVIDEYKQLFMDKLGEPA